MCEKSYRLHRYHVGFLLLVDVGEVQEVAHELDVHEVRLVAELSDQGSILALVVGRVDAVQEPVRPVEALFCRSQNKHV